jgi:hypothetical protein
VGLRKSSAADVVAAAHAKIRGTKKTRWADFTSRKISSTLRGGYSWNAILQLELRVVFHDPSGPAQD